MSDHDVWPSDMETDEEEVARLRAKVERGITTNRSTMEYLASLGVRPDTMEHMQLRIEVMVTAIFGNYQSLNRLKFEVMWQNALADILSEKVQEAKKSKLIVPGR